MCLLTYTLPDAWPDFENLEDAALTNSDGFGWAIVSEGQIIRGASLSIDEALTTYNDNLIKHAGSSLFHLRFATHGVRDLSNVHPFSADRGRTSIAHNGIISRVSPKGTESDTAAFVRRYWPSWANPRLDTATGLAHLEGWLGRSNKLVILTTDPRYKSDHYIANEPEGHWSEGTWYSNHSYLWRDPWADSARVPYSELMPGCRGYSSGCLCDQCVVRDDRGLRATLEHYALTCGICKSEYLVGADILRPTCPVCDCCWYCDSDVFSCLCENGGDEK